ncbi:Ulilysin [Dactylellina cionopaga]|nr:Ulilysin [Dactylellina cionopaga]
MKFSVFTVLALLASGSIAKRLRCGNSDEKTPEEAAQSLELVSIEKAGSMRRAPSSAVAAAAAGIQIIRLYVHNVYKDETVAGGFLTIPQIKKQVAALNAGFNNTGFKFRLKTITHTKQKWWAISGDGKNATKMRKALRMGGYADLNLYLRPFPTYLGQCSSPKGTPTNAQIIADGCDILHTTIPGGSETDYDEGKTAVHEVGHWMGLEHTFRGKCAEANGGDYIADTPAQKSLTEGCPVTRDSCPGKEGLDPIHNYMDYSDEYVRFFSS